MTTKQLQICKRESHRLQFEGKDYQQAAYDALAEVAATLEGGPAVSEDELNEIQSSPNPECDCGFCAKAQWQE